MELQLVVVAGPETGRVIPLLEGKSLVIGRGGGSDTQINDPRMSRVHCVVQVDCGHVILTDSGGAGGTLIEGKAIDKQELLVGQVFQAGSSKFRLQLPAAAEASTLTEPLGEAQPRAEAPMLSQLVGQSFLEYQLESILAKGSTGMVFKARDTHQNRIVAVKVLSPEYARTEEQRRRFLRAMETMLPVKHENIVELYRAGKKGLYCWAAMEYVEGESMTQVIQRIGVSGMLDWREAYRVAVHIGRALEAAEAHKIIHRNVTPPNILRRKSDKLTKLGDLVLAKALEGTLARQITGPGQLVGDVAYMSPERTREGAEVDCRSDIYGLGATCYALLTGRPPFEARSLPELVKRIREERPVPPTKYQLSIPGLFVDVVMQMLAKRPDERYASPTALLQHLARVGKYENFEI